jgi:hypothetical protein
MKVVLLVKYGKRVDRIEILVGESKQNFRWLGHASATMYVLMNAHVVQEVRGRALIHGAVSAITELLPVNIYSEMCTFYNPDAVLVDELQDGQEVMVDLVDRFEIDNDTQILLLTKWAFAAFRSGPEYEKEREKLVQGKINERDGCRRLRESQDIASRLERNRPRIAQMKHVLREQLFDETIVKKVALKEWDNIAASVILDKTVPREADQQVLRGLMIKHHPDVSALFKFFSSINSGGSTDRVEYIEFNKFCIETKVFGDGDHSAAILRIFVESQSTSERMGAGVNVHSEMKRHEFFISLVKVALYKFVTLEKRRIATLKRNGYETKYAHANVPTAPQAFESLFAEYLKPAIDRIGGLMVREYLGCDEVLLLLYDSLDALIPIFNHYAEIGTAGAKDDQKVGGEEKTLSKLAADGKQVAPWGLMSLKGFARFVSDGSFVGAFDKSSGLENESGLSATSIRQIFSASQHDWFENEDEINFSSQASALEGRRHQEMMSFAEFTEAVVRVGLTSNDEIKGTSDDEGLNRVIRAVSTASDI